MGQRSNCSYAFSSGHIDLLISSHKGLWSLDSILILVINTSTWDLQVTTPRICAHLLLYIWVTCNLCIKYRMFLLWFLTLLQLHLVFLDGKKRMLNSWIKAYLVTNTHCRYSRLTFLPLWIFTFLLRSFTECFAGRKKLDIIDLWAFLLFRNTWLRACVNTSFNWRTVTT